MMNINKALFEQGRADALALQKESLEMDNTQLYLESERIPSFQKALKIKNMLKRPIGFTCKTSEGRIVRLLQPYDSSTYTDEPEKLPAQWGFAWSKEPKDARSFIKLSTSPYGKGECCVETLTTYSGKEEKHETFIYRSLIDNNVHSPSEYPQGWEKIDENGELITE